MEHDKALLRVIVALLADGTQLFKQFSDNESFKRWLTDTVFDPTYQEKFEITGDGPGPVRGFP